MATVAPATQPMDAGPIPDDSQIVLNLTLKPVGNLHGHASTRSVQAFKREIEEPNELIDNLRDYIRDLRGLNHQAVELYRIGDIDPVDLPSADGEEGYKAIVCLS